MEPQGPTEYNLGRLDPRQFESLVFLLAQSVDPKVVPVRPHDHGLDARLPDVRGRTVRGWQAKRFTGAINWVECTTSIRRAKTFWRPPHITFCFPKDLSAAEQEQFRTKLVDSFPEVRLDFWSGGELQRLIRDSEEGQRAAAWLFSNPAADYEAMRRALALGGELADTRQAVERQLEIQRFLDRDPHLSYTMISRNRATPETPPAGPTVLSIALVAKDREVRIDAVPRYSGALDDAGAVPGLAFSDDDAGREAFEVIGRLAREGGRATISSGLGAIMNVVPLGLRGLFPDEGFWGEAEVIAEEPRGVDIQTMRVPVVVRCGGHELGMVLSEAGGADDWIGGLHGAVGGLELFYLLRDRNGEVESRLDWRYAPGEGSGLEQLLVVQLLLTAVGGSLVEIVHADGELVVAGVLGAPDAESWRAELVDRATYFGYVAELEAWLGQPLDPPAAPSADDAAVLAEVIPRIRQPSTSIAWGRVELAPGCSPPPADRSFQFAVLQPLYATLFGRQLLLGVEMINLTEGNIETDDCGRVSIIPVNGVGEGNCRLFRPDEAPTQAASPPM